MSCLYLLLHHNQIAVLNHILGLFCYLKDRLERIIVMVAPSVQLDPFHFYPRTHVAAALPPSCTQLSEGMKMKCSRYRNRFLC